MRKYLYIFLVLIVIAIGLLHFFTPGDLFFYHDIYRRFSYFPIVLSAVWFGFWGGFSIALMSSIFFIPHILLYMGQGFETYVSEVMEIVLYMAAGSVTGLIVSKQNKLREKYKQLSEKLERSYAKLHRETQLLIEAEEQLSTSQKFSALGRLAASLAHEIKNPLSSIKGTAEILLDEFTPGHPKREFAQILLKEIGRLNTTVEEVLQYSRGQKGKIGTTEPLNQVLNQVTRLLASPLRKKAVTLEIVQNEIGNTFQVDGSRLSQVFLNIILNAIDAVSKGGKITIELASAADGLSITFNDNGPGITAEERKQIFKPFFTGKENGTGLGLSISRKIVESYGGILSVEESKFGGACFIVFLPPPESYPSTIYEKQSANEGIETN